MGAQITFETHIINQIKKITEPIVQKHAEELWTVLLNEVSGDSVPRIINRQASPRDLFCKKVFFAYNEISIAYEGLKDIEIYIGRFPYADTNINRISHLKYHVANYMNSVYIFKERLCAYLNKARKWYKADPRYSVLLRLVKPLFKDIENCLQPILRIRGMHVHEKEYEDPDIDRLIIIEALIRAASVDEKFPKDLGKVKDAEYKEIRRKYRKEIKETNKSISELLDNYFKVFLEIFFDEYENFIYPQAIEQA
ncbi:MAG: hypothetical protein JW749_01035 [Sedimentisphaerales bacterium]|nr:hypothetical protein [Sedimentisphaerales bacterium]